MLGRLALAAEVEEHNALMRVMEREDKGEEEEQESEGSVMFRNLKELSSFVSAFLLSSIWLKMLCEDGGSLVLVTLLCGAANAGKLL